MRHIMNGTDSKDATGILEGNIEYTEKIINEFLKSKDIDVEFIEAPGEHTWEFCDKYIKEFIKTLR